MIDVDLVTRKIVLITRDLPALEKLAREPREHFNETSAAELMAERLLERMIGRMIDINYHLITVSGEEPPRDYYESFIALGRLGILDQEFASRIAAAAGLRNRIAHEYNDIEPAKVLEALQWAVRDIPLYLKKIEERLHP